MKKLKAKPTCADCDYSWVYDGSPGLGPQMMCGIDPAPHSSATDNTTWQYRAACAQYNKPRPKPDVSSGAVLAVGAALFALIAVIIAIVELAKAGVL